MLVTPVRLLNDPFNAAVLSVTCDGSLVMTGDEGTEALLELAVSMVANGFERPAGTASNFTVLSLSALKDASENKLVSILIVVRDVRVDKNAVSSTILLSKEEVELLLIDEERDESVVAAETFEFPKENKYNPPSIINIASIIKNLFFVFILFKPISFNLKIISIYIRIR